MLKSDTTIQVHGFHAGHECDKHSSGHIGTVKSYFTKSVFVSCYPYLLMWLPFYGFCVFCHFKGWFDRVFINNLDSHVMVLLIMLFMFHLTNAFHANMEKFKDGISTYVDVMYRIQSIYLAYVNNSDTRLIANANVETKRLMHEKRDRLGVLCKILMQVVHAVMKDNLNIENILAEYHIDIEDMTYVKGYNRKCNHDNAYNIIIFSSIEKHLYDIMKFSNEKQWLLSSNNLERVIDNYTSSVHKLTIHKRFIKEYYTDEFIKVGFFIISVIMTFTNIQVFGPLWAFVITSLILYLFMGTWARGIQVRSMWTDDTITNTSQTTTDSINTLKQIIKRTCI